MGVIKKDFNVRYFWKPHCIFEEITQSSPCCVTAYFLYFNDQPTSPCIVKLYQLSGYLEFNLVFVYNLSSIDVYEKIIARLKIVFVKYALYESVFL